MRAPSPANGRTAIPAASHTEANCVVWSPRRSQTKFASVSGTVQPSARRAARYPVAFLDDRLHALQELVLGVQRGYRGGLGHRADREGEHRLAHGLGHGLVADEEADAEAGQAVGLGEGAEHGHVRTAPVEVDAVGDARVADVLAVGLVEDNQAVTGNLIEEVGELLLADDRARGVVGVADQDEPRLRRDRLGHRRQVVGLLPEGNPDRRGACQVRERRVRLERAPGVENFAAWIADGLYQLLEDPHRAAADGDMAGRHGEPLRDRTDQRLRAVVRVAVDAATRLRDDLKDRRQRPVRRLVGGQLVRFAGRDDRRLARLVRGKRAKHGPEPG